MIQKYKREESSNFKNVKMKFKSVLLTSLATLGFTAALTSNIQKKL